MSDAANPNLITTPVEAAVIPAILPAEPSERGALPGGLASADTAVDKPPPSLLRRLPTSGVAMAGVAVIGVALGLAVTIKRAYGTLDETRIEAMDAPGTGAEDAS